MVLLAAEQPERPLEQPGVERRLGAPVLAVTATLGRWIRGRDVMSPHQRASHKPSRPSSNATAGARRAPRPGASSPTAAAAGEASLVWSIFFSGLRPRPGTLRPEPLDGSSRQRRRWCCPADGD